MCPPCLQWCTANVLCFSIVSLSLSRKWHYLYCFSYSIFLHLMWDILPSVLWHCWLGGRKGIWPVKTEWWGASMVISLEWGADLHTAQLMPLPLTVSCFSKIQIGLPFWYRLTRVVPHNWPLNGCVFVSSGAAVWERVIESTVGGTVCCSEMWPRGQRQKARVRRDCCLLAISSGIISSAHSSLRAMVFRAEWQNFCEIVC